MIIKGVDKDNSSFTKTNAKYSSVLFYKDKNTNTYTVIDIPYDELLEKLYYQNLVYNDNTIIDFKPIYSIGEGYSYSTITVIKVNKYTKTNDKLSIYKSFPSTKPLNINDTDMKNGVFYIHDNNTRPLYVEVYPNKIKIYINQTRKLIMTIKNFKHIFLKIDIETYKDYNNLQLATCPNILVYLGNLRYIMIGREIIKFKSREKIYQFLPHIGNNDVLYSIAISKNYVYFLSNDIIYMHKDYIYNVYYAYNEYYSNSNENKSMKYVEIKHMILQERL